MHLHPHTRAGQGMLYPVNSILWPKFATAAPTLADRFGSDLPLASPTALLPPESLHPQTESPPGLQHLEWDLDDEADGGPDRDKHRRPHLPTTQDPAPSAGTLLGMTETGARSDRRRRREERSGVGEWNRPDPSGATVYIIYIL